MYLHSLFICLVLHQACVSVKAGTWSWFLLPQHLTQYWGIRDYGINHLITLSYRMEVVFSHSHAQSPRARNQETGVSNLLDEIWILIFCEAPRFVFEVLTLCGKYKLFNIKTIRLTVYVAMVILLETSFAFGVIQRTHFTFLNAL